jgi:hypothetical protein
MSNCSLAYAEYRQIKPLSAKYIDVASYISKTEDFAGVRSRLDREANTWVARGGRR